jgi:Protein of unknown function (DUF3891)
VPPLQALRPAIREFVESEERRQTKLAAQAGFDEPERWLAYRQLQVYDVISLYLGMADLAGRESTEIPPPSEGPRIDRGLPEQPAVTLSPAGASWTVACDPFPFGADPALLTMRRRLLKKRSWNDETDFRRDFWDAETEEVTLRLTRA